MSSNTITIGLDLGYGVTKAVASSGKQVCFESRVAPAEFIRFQADLGAQVETGGLTLHDPVEGPLFVGELASKQGRPGGMMLTSALDLVEGRVAVMDIGTFTTDLILVEGLEYIEARSSSIEVGVATAIEMVRKVLLDDYRVSYEPHELEQALRRGWLVIDGKKEKLNGLASERLDPIARSIEAQARTLWNVSTLSALVLAGGGSLALRPWLEPRFSQAIYAPDAAMANAAGFLILQRNVGCQGAE
jgi:hypothetical protein